MSLRPKLRSLEEDEAAFAAGRLDVSSTRVVNQRGAAATNPAAARAVRFDLEDPDVGFDGAAEHSTAGVRSSRLAEAEPAASQPSSRSSAAAAFASGSETHGSGPAEGAELLEGLGGVLFGIHERERGDQAIDLHPRPSAPLGFPKPFAAVTKPDATKSDAPSGTAPASGGGRQTAKKTRGVSLFKQRMLAQRGEQAAAPQPKPKPVAAGPRHAASGPRASAAAPVPNTRLAGASSDPEIGAENDMRIAAMSEAEIEEAQAEIRNMFSPEVLERFMKKLDRDANAKSAAANPKPLAPAPPAATTSGSSPMDLSWIRSEEDLDRAANEMLPDYEKAKLQWTGRVDGPTPAPKKPSAASTAGLASIIGEEYMPSSEATRFDLRGMAMDPADAAATSHSAGLHHHADDPEAGGYTMRELETLARSQNSAQKSLALSCISKILRERQRCLYENQSKHELFSLPTQLAMTLRLALDSSNATAVCEAMSALESFLVPLAFQDQLAALWRTGDIGLVLPEAVPRAQGALAVFKPELDAVSDDREQDAEKDAETTDAERIDASPVLGLMHTALIDRLAFLLGSHTDIKTGVELSPAARASAYRILAHVCLHSARGAQAVSDCRPLRQLLVNRLCAVAAPNETHEIEATEELLFLLAALAGGCPANAAALAAQHGPQLTAAAVALATQGHEAAVSFLRIWRASCPEIDVAAGFAAGALGPAAGVRLHLFQIDDVTAAVRYAEAAVLNIVDASLESPGELAAEQAWLICRFARQEYAATHGRSEPKQALVHDLTTYWKAATGEAPSLTPPTPLLERATTLITQALAQSSAPDHPSLPAIDRLLALVEALYVLGRWPALRVRIADASGVRRALHQLLEALPAHVARGPSRGMLLSPTGLGVRRLVHRLQVMSIAALSRVFGSVRGATGAESNALESNNDDGDDEAAEAAARRKALAMAMPVNPHLSGETELALQVLTALLGPSLSPAGVAREARAEMLDVFKQSLGTGDGSNGPLRIMGHRGSQTGMARRLGDIWRAKWEDAASAWPLLPMQTAFNDDSASFLASTLFFCQALLQDGAIEPADLVLALARFLKDNETPCANEPVSIQAMNAMLDAAISALPRRTWFVVLAEAAGGVFKILELWKGLLIAFNEHLNGHETAAALLLVMFRMEADTEVRCTLWTELHGSNLLRLVELPRVAPVTSLEESDFITPTETNPEILQCLCAALCRRALTPRNNPFLYRVALHHLVNYLWEGGPLSWNRKRILKELLRARTYWDVVTGTPSAPRSASVLPAARKGLSVVAGEEPSLWTQIHEDGLLSLKEDV